MITIMWQRFVRNNLGSDDGGGEEFGGSKRSERPEAEPGENGESQSRSMSIGEEPLAETSKVVFGLRSEVFRDPSSETSLNTLRGGFVIGFDHTSV